MLLVMGCAGDLPKSGEPPGDMSHTATSDAVPDSGSGQEWLLPDLGAKDAPWPDASPSWTDTGLPTGGPCPCQKPLLCASGACRAPCLPPVDGCKVVSNCPSTHGCVPLVNLPGTHVCLPGVAAGQACGNNIVCTVGNVCGSVSGGSYLCLPVCSTLGAACGSGGNCLQSGSCLFCSQP